MYLGHCCFLGRNKIQRLLTSKSLNRVTVLHFGTEAGVVFVQRRGDRLALAVDEGEQSPELPLYIGVCRSATSSVR